MKIDYDMIYKKFLKSKSERFDGEETYGQVWKSLDEETQKEINTFIGYLKLFKELNKEK